MSSLRTFSDVASLRVDSGQIMTYSRSPSSSPTVVIVCAGSSYCTVVHNRLRKRVPDHADYTGPTRQQLDSTRSGLDDLSALKDPDHELWD